MLIQLVAFQNNKNILPWEDNIDIYQINLYGIAIIYRGINYIFSTSHRLDIDSKVFIKDGLLEIDKYIFNKDLDIVIYKCKYKIDYSSNINIKLNFDKDSIFTIYNNNKITFNQLMCRNMRIARPSVLSIICIDKNTYIKEGDSGSGILYNDNYIGIVSGIYKEAIVIIPIFTYIMFLDHYDKNNNLCYFYHNLEYKDNKLLLSKTKNEFRKKDEIIEIDNNKIVDGNIYCDILDIPINIELYFLFFKDNLENTVFKIIRNKNIRIINYISYNYENLLCIDNSYITKYEIIKNKIKIELNINFIEYLLDNELDIPKIPDKFLNNIFVKKKYMFINI